MWFVMNKKVIKKIIIDGLTIILFLLILIGLIFTLYKLQEDRIDACKERGGTYGLISMTCEINPLENRIKELEDKIKELE